MKVKITEGGGWYDKKVGEVFEVNGVGHYEDIGAVYYVDPPESSGNGEGRRFVLEADCEVLKVETETIEYQGLKYEVTDDFPTKGDLVVVTEQEDREYSQLVGDVYEVTEVDDDYDYLNVDGTFADGSELFFFPREVKKLKPMFEIAPEGEVVADVVNSPSHYTSGKFETIEVIEELTKGYTDGFTAYNVGNTIKYVARAPYKHDDGGLTDLKKARKYLDFAIQSLEGDE